MKIVHLFLGLILVSTCPKLIYSCACCSDGNEFIQGQGGSVDLEGLKLNGELGVYIYGGEGKPESEYGRGSVSGTITQEVITFVLTRDKKVLGSLIVKIEEPLNSRRMNLNFLLPADDLKKLGEKAGVGVYHEESFNVSVHADEKLKKALGSSFSKEGTLTLHGNSNSCWEPKKYGGRWTLEYSLQSGRNGMGRGTFLAG